ncbi:MAG: hypothetical protein KIS78_21615 [Labilithrix sp.]|nr:hypothetical protein [Labilithrix sp.]MCW5835013.1 hypothetical protein [Labilithrix sp.]
MASESLDEERSGDTRLVVLERNALVARLSVAALAAGVALFAAFVSIGFAPGIFGVHLVGIGVVLRYVLGRRNWASKRRERAVRVTPAGVHVDGVLAVPRAGVADGFFQPRAGGGSSVRLVDERRRVVFEAELFDKEASAFLRVLGLDAASRRAEFRGASPIGSSTVMHVVFVVTLFVVASFAFDALTAIGVPASPLFTALAMLPVFFAAMAPSKIVVGVDGVLLRWFWRERFIPLSDIASLSVGDLREVLLRLASGETVTIHTTNTRRNLSEHHRQHRDAVYARIVEAVNAHRRNRSSADVALFVARGERSLAAWRSALEAIARGDGSYREAAVRDEDLWRLVEDPRAAEDARAGAAFLLRRSLDADGKARVRVAAEATASPRLRVALDAAAGESDEAVEAALAELGAPDDAPRTRAR